MVPVDTKVIESYDYQICPDYTKYITHPMDLSKIQKRVNSNKYTSYQQFEYDMKLVIVKIYLR